MLLALLTISVAIAQTGSVVTINGDKVLVINGQKKFPIGFSPGPPNNSVTPTGKDALQEFRDAGALLFRISQSTDWGSSLIATQQIALDWAQQHGMYCWVNLRELSKFAAGDAATEAELRSIINQFKNHPAVGVWKNFDEAWWGGVPVADLQRGYDVIKLEDTNHPVVQTHAPRGSVADLQPYNVATDILALDIYPVGYPPGANSTNVNKEISMVGDYAVFLNQVGNGQRHFWVIEQIAWSGVTGAGKTLRFPTFEQERFMAYHAIIHGARGLMFFGGNNALALNSRDAPFGWNWTFWDNVLKRVVQELGDNSLLADALVTTNSSLPVQANRTNVDFCVREVRPYLYVLAAAREGPTTNVTFTGLPNWANTGELLYESPRIVQAAGGAFTDWFAPFEVHAYRFLNPSNPPVNPPSGPLFLYEPFDYTNVSGPVSSNTPSNWTYGGSNPNDLSVVSGSLNFPGLATSTGNSVTNGGSGLGVRRLFGTNLNSGKIYFSALFRINNLGFGSWNGAASTLGALTANDNTSFRLAVQVKSNSPAGYVIGVRKSGAGANTTFSPTEHAVGETILLVGRYDFTVSPNTVALWVSPDASTFGAVTEPGGFISANSGTDGFTIDRFNMRQNTTSSVPAAMQWDELRFGFAWADVTPPTAPVAITLTDVQKTSSGAFRFGYAGTAPGGEIYASTNLTDWVAIGAATVISPGLYQFTDTSATNHPHRFYQLRSP